MEEYKYVIVPFVTLILAQIFKFTFESIEAKELKWGRLFTGTGGMPSSHSSFSFSVTGMMLFNYGLSSVYFAIALIFSMIVAYDSMGLRKESGRHAEQINKIADEIFTKDLKSGLRHLKEELGHNPEEVIMGVFLGMLMSYLFTFIIF